MNVQKSILIFSTVVLALASGTVFGGCEGFTNRSGNTSIKCSDGTTGQLYTDRFGYTTGRIGSLLVRMYRDSFGNTTGHIGDLKVNIRSDRFGNTTGHIGNLPVDTRRDSVGNTTGTVGDSPLKCYTDRGANTTCRGRELAMPLR